MGRDAQRLPVLCAPCRKKLAYIHAPRCMKCGKQLTDVYREYCGDCERCRHDFNQGIAVFSYTEGMRQSIYRFKYKNKREYAKWYGQALYKALSVPLRIWQPQVILPVPLHPGRYRQRGFNQAELLARMLGRAAGLPVDSAYLHRTARTEPMKKLNDQERIKNLENAFKIMDNSVRYNKVLLVDDIYTTGATVDACARVLKEHGVREVYAAYLCIGNGFS